MTDIHRFLHRVVIGYPMFPRKLLPSSSGRLFSCSEKGFYPLQLKGRCTRWCSWLRHCAISRKVAGWFPDCVTGIFHWLKPSSLTMALGSNQRLTEMSTSNISWGVKAASAEGWKSYHLHVPIVFKSGSFNLLKPSGPALACNGIALPFTCYNWRQNFLSISSAFTLLQLPRRLGPHFTPKHRTIQALHDAGTQRT